MGLDIDWHVSVLRKPVAALSSEDDLMVGKVKDYFNSVKEYYEIINAELTLKSSKREVCSCDDASCDRCFEDQMERRQNRADSESFASSMLPGINPEDIEHLGEN